MVKNIYYKFWLYLEPIKYEACLALTILDLDEVSFFVIAKM